PTKASLLAFRGTYELAQRRHVTVLGAAGDWGATSQTAKGTYYDRRVINWPASDPLVTAVGGTQILLDAAGKQVSPTRVWNDDGTTVPPSAGGGGVSIIFARPSWQIGVAAVVGKHRGIPDVSMDASCNPGAYVYASYPGTFGGESPVCGTSLASPLFAGIVALADQLAGHDLGLLNPTLYRLGADHAPGLVDVTHGNNSVRIPLKDGTAVVTGFAAVKGYDLASGWGTVKAAALVPELAGTSLP
ncbi:MAG TPA: S53 family peptidase, partial [Acidimicrobiales bacterium]|nr:S53 family peptidase [Acidimicrobiales bacterium]